MRVCKFGGSVLKDAEGFRRVREIVQTEERRVIVPSAPGRRGEGDEKVTDLLYACQRAAAAGRPFAHLFDQAAERYRTIAQALGLPAPDEALRQVYRGLKAGASPAWAASRGEWLCGLLLSRYLALPFVDAAEAIRFDGAGRLLAEETAGLLRSRLRGGAVLPGFYGADGQGVIHTFPRGGSDVTAALAAAALNADAYENWKDVRGVYAADPALIPDARIVPELSYRALRALSAQGAQVLAEEAVAPVRAAGIPLNIRSALDPAHPGTLIHAAPPPREGPAAIAVTCMPGLTLLRLEKQDGGLSLAGMALESALPIERMALDRDAVSLLLRGGEDAAAALRARAERVREEKELCMLSVVGEGLGRIDGAARLGAALSAAGVRAPALHQPPQGLYITALLSRDEYPAALRAAYDAFIRE